MVASPSDVDEYLEVAEALFNGRITETDLPTAIVNLPPLTHRVLQALAALAEKAALSQPKRAWAITAVAAARQTDSAFLSGLATWYLACAANAWVRPQRVETAVARARTNFAASGERAWMAACDWQLNALPWTRPDFKEAAATLTRALNNLEAARMDDLVPDCRLSLAYAHLLIGHFELAVDLTTSSEKTYRAQNDQVGLGRCLLTRSSILRRQSRFAEAHACLEQALTLFQQLDAPVLIAQTHFQLAYTSLLSQDGFDVAEIRFVQACELFETCDLPLWLAQCYGGLAQIYNESGRLREAGEVLQEAREIYAKYEIYGLKGDILLDSGWVEFYRGNYTATLQYFGQAGSLYRQTGNQWMPAICVMNQGQVYLYLGHYQRALHYLERAYSQLQVSNISYRIATCEKNIATCWARLGQYQLAYTYLDKAIAHYKEAKQDKYLYELYNLRANILFSESRNREAIPLLQNALAIARQEGADAEAAASMRLLGEALCTLKEFEQAFAYLEAAENSFFEMGMNMEVAYCQVAWGNYYTQVSNLQSAQAAWKQALALNQDVMPDITWQSHAGLAAVSEAGGDHKSALAHYRAMIRALTRLRRGLWQPALAGSFLHRPLSSLDAAISLAARQAAHLDALHFIEESKAQTVARQLTADSPWRSARVEQTELTDLATEIRWLQERLVSTFENQPVASHLSAQIGLRQQLARTTAAYDQLKGRLEREQLAARPEIILPDSFDPDHFRQQAAAALGQNWLALNYYLAGEELCGVMVAPDSCLAWVTPISSQARLALQLITRPGPAGENLAERPLKRLGAWLLPGWLQERLTPETILILSPHRHLHHLPWPALYLRDEPLVTACVPVITPSLLSLALLWQRPFAPSSTANAGLLLATSDFRGRHPSLPAVPQEATLIAAAAGPAGEQLVESAATWGNLTALAGAEGLARFAFWHIASHAFYDGLSGRLSGIALYDRDVWLDELWQLAPLPPLVTLSACSGGRTLVYTGDEHVSLTTTCLAAGAQCVVGALWPLLDEHAPDLMHRFYRHRQSGTGVAQALASAQREALQSGQDVRHWGAFHCIGQP